MLKSVAIWLVKKYAVSAIQDAVAAKSPEVATWSKRISGYITKVHRVLAFLNDLAGRLSDGELSKQEAQDTIAEAKDIAEELTK